MLLPNFQITQKDCNSLIFKDITPAYSAKNLNGYGGPNVAAGDITKTVITLDFGPRDKYQIETVYNQTKPDLVIKASDIPYQANVAPPCSDCGPNPCGCEDCDDSYLPEEDCFGNLKTFPSGCIVIKQEVFQSTVSKGFKILKIVSICKEQKMLSEIADKLTTPVDCTTYSFYDNKEKTREIKNELVLSKLRLDLMASDTPECDCDCIASRIKQVSNYLESVK